MSVATLSAIDQIRSHLRTAGEAIYHASVLYVAELDKDPGFSLIMRENFPTLTSAFLRDLESVGRGQLDRRVLELGLSCGTRLKSLPLSQQRQVLEKGLTVWTGADTRVIPLADCGPRVLLQCLSKDHVRTPEEQAAWHEEQSARHRQDAANTKTKALKDGNLLVYRVDVAKKRVRILRPPCYLTAKELSDILDDLL